MKFKVSEQTAVQVTDPQAAAAFYGGVLGLPIRDQQGIQAVDAGPLTLYIDPADLTDGIILELITEDVEAARTYLTERGCRVLRWEGAGKVCLIEDPFGIRFNLWQEPAVD
jgi:catechol 2,3-dioxygenase-like lactoylglutathione lyase family enzyme